jgi:hypothetical protein
MTVGVAFDLTGVDDSSHAVELKKPYYGDHIDARVKPGRADLVGKAVVPDYALGPHTASVGLAYSNSTSLPPGSRQP